MQKHFHSFSSHAQLSHVGLVGSAVLRSHCWQTWHKMLRKFCTPHFSHTQILSCIVCLCSLKLFPTKIEHYAIDIIPCHHIRLDAPFWGASILFFLLEVKFTHEFGWALCKGGKGVGFLDEILYTCLRKYGVIAPWLVSESALVWLQGGKLISSLERVLCNCNIVMVPEIYQTSNYIYYYSFNYQYQVEYLLV